MIIFYFKNIIMKFFNTPNEKMLTIHISPSGIPQPSLGIQPAAKTKLSYFVRRQPINITEVNYRDELIPGDMSSKPIDELDTLIQEVLSKCYYN